MNNRYCYKSRSMIFSAVCPKWHHSLLSSVSSDEDSALYSFSLCNVSKNRLSTSPSRVCVSLSVCDLTHIHTHLQKIIHTSSDWSLAVVQFTPPREQRCIERSMCFLSNARLKHNTVLTLMNDSLVHEKILFAFLFGFSFI